MSFGWSAGDVATAIALTYKLIQALDTCDGAAGDYREAVSFLRDLTRSLEPLQAFTSCNANLIYGRQIEEQVKCIKEPVERFLANVRKYEPSLGTAAKEGHHQHIIRKLQWTMTMSKKVLGLRKRIEYHMRIIDTVMQRLTLYVAHQIFILSHTDTNFNSDAVLGTQQRLPLNLQLAFQQTIRPELVTILQDHLAPLSSTLIGDIRTVQTKSDEVLATRLAEYYGDFSASLQEIKNQLTDSTNMQTRIESFLQGDVSRSTTRALTMVESDLSRLSLGNGLTDTNLTQPTAEIIRQSLTGV
jgi:hypothetical protein